MASFLALVFVLCLFSAQLACSEQLVPATALSDPAHAYFQQRRVFNPADFALASRLVNESATMLDDAAMVDILKSNSDETLDDWVLVWEEDFAGSEVNDSRWNVANNSWHGVAGSERQGYMADEVYLANNTYLVIQTEKKPIVIHNVSYDYTSGTLDTQSKFAFLYGRCEFRAKMPKGTATAAWPALWLMPDPGLTNPPNLCWPMGGEIDVLEQWGNRVYDPIASSLHWGTACGQDKRPLPGDYYPLPFHQQIDYSADFHIFGVEWNETSLVFSVDGNNFFTITNATDFIPNSPFYPIINTAVTKHLPIGPFAEYPAWHVVDWVRVYQKPGAEI